ncbi:MAG: hypothetical protein ACKV19_06505 [Verrucomicrobiales bacterium]
MASASALSAATLVSGTLADYFALEPAGGTIGTTQFSNFMIEPLQTGAEALDPEFIIVNPINTPGLPTLQFVIEDSAIAGDFFNLRFSYTVSDIALAGAFLGIDDTSATFNGGVTAITDLEILGQPSENLLTFRTAEDFELSEQLNFPSTTSLAITMDITLDGGGDGSATLGTVTSQFAVIPEPMTTSLLAPVVGLLALFRRRHS